MCTRISLNFITVATKFHSNIFIQPVHKFTVSRFKYFIQTHVLITRGCSSGTFLVSKHYKKLDEEKLNDLLKDPRYKALYDTLSLEIEYTKYETGKVPSKLTATNWLYLLKTTTKGERRSYIDFLFKLEKKEENQKQKLKAKAEEKENRIDDENRVYGLGKCTLFHRIVESTMNNFYNGRLISAMLHEPALVFDLGFEEHMSQLEISNCAKQLLISFSTHRQHIDPFNLYFCNVVKNSDLMKKLHKTIPNIYNLDFPLNITSKSYLEIFDKKKLVYLSPQSNEIMTHYNPELVYIIGAIVDKRHVLPISYQKARREGIKTMRFPLNELLNWGTGSSKNLPLNQVLSIMLDLRHTNNWDKALENVPKRKLQESREQAMRKKLMKSVTSLQRAKNSELINKKRLESCHKFKIR